MLCPIGREETQKAASGDTGTLPGPAGLVGNPGGGLGLHSQRGKGLASPRLGFSKDACDST